jgi:1-acyl-sn-glycerol-3-phosphate acyltransferase
MHPQVPSTPPKPVSNLWRPELTRLPPLNSPRRAFRGLVRLLARFLIRVLTCSEIHGLEHLPRGAALFVTNHLGDADAALLLSALPFAPEGLAKIDLLHEIPVLWRVMDWYGVVWLHRGRVDRRALDFAVQALQEGRSLVIAPEGRYSLTGNLERGTGGASYVARGAHVPVVPLALTGTQNRLVYRSLRQRRRPRLTLTVGEPFELHLPANDPIALHAATQLIMESIARLLPEECRGAYSQIREPPGSAP